MVFCRRRFLVTWTNAERTVTRNLPSWLFALLVTVILLGFTVTKHFGWAMALLIAVSLARAVVRIRPGSPDSLLPNLKRRDYLVALLFFGGSVIALAIWSEGSFLAVLVAVLSLWAGLAYFALNWRRIRAGRTDRVFRRLVS